MDNELPHLRRKRRTPAEIAVILSEYRASKMTAVEFCLSRQLHHPTFTTWQGRYKVAKRKTPPTPGFAAIQVQQSPSLALFAEVNDVKIYQPVPASFLKQLMR